MALPWKVSVLVFATLVVAGMGEYSITYFHGGTKCKSDVNRTFSFEPIGHDCYKNTSAGEEAGTSFSLACYDDAYFAMMEFETPDCSGTVYQDFLILHGTTQGDCAPFTDDDGVNHSEYWDPPLAPEHMPSCTKPLTSSMYQVKQYEGDKCEGEHPRSMVIEPVGHDCYKYLQGNAAGYSFSLTCAGDGLMEWTDYPSGDCSGPVYSAMTASTKLLKGECDVWEDDAGALMSDLLDRPMAEEHAPSCMKEMKCIDAKILYQENHCCGNPDKVIEKHPSRRMTASSTESVLDAMRSVLLLTKRKKGPKAASDLAAMWRQSLFHK